jgi:hypothetical protein
MSGSDYTTPTNVIPLSVDAVGVVHLIFGNRLVMERNFPISVHQESPPSAKHENVFAMANRVDHRSDFFNSSSLVSIEWWRWRESNPRPKAIHVGSYTLSWHICKASSAVALPTRLCKLSMLRLSDRKPWQFPLVSIL